MSVLLNPNFILRAEQELPLGDWKTWTIAAGRGWGKTAAASRAVVRLITEQGYKRVALIGQTYRCVHELMLEPISELLSAAGFHNRINRTTHHIRCHGIEVFGYSGVVTSLRGPLHDLVWADEPSRWENRTVLFDAELGLRLGPLPRKIVTDTCVHPDKAVSFVS